jgi:hypothetical protein
MEVREGDKLICVKKASFFHRDMEKDFTNGKIYEVKKIIMGNPNGPIPFDTLVIYDDRNSIRFLNYNKLGPSLGKILMSIKQLRRKKLIKISNGISI